MSKEKNITTCPQCGSEVFILNEHIVYKAAVDPKTGILETYAVQDNGIDDIFCSNCQKGFAQEDFHDIQFCS